MGDETKVEPDGSDLTQDTNRRESDDMDTDNEEQEQEEHTSDADGNHGNEQDDETSNAVDNVKDTPDESDDIFAPILDNTVSLQERLGLILQLYEKERDTLNSTHMKDYQGVPTLTRLSETSPSVFDDYENHVIVLYTCMKQVRQTIGETSEIIQKKLTNEGLRSWLTGPAAPQSDKEQVASEASLLAGAAEARAEAGRAAADVARAEELALRLEAEAAEAGSAAQQAAIEVERAREAADRAMQAAEEKKRVEEEAKRKAEEERRKKEEEAEKKRKEEEKRRKHDERTAGSPEEQERRRQEEEKKNPKNWPQQVYSVDPAATGMAVGCVVRALPGLLSYDDLIVEQIDQLDGTLKLDDNEELVGNIVSIKWNGESKKLDEAAMVALPHCAPRNVPSREPVIKKLRPDGSWTELASKEVVFDDMKEFKFMETRLSGLAGVLCVVTRIKRETHTVYKRGGKVTPTVDARICFTFKSATFKNNTSLNVEIQPVELGAVTDLKVRHPDQCNALLAFSPVVHFSIPHTKLPKPMLVTVPVPPNPSKPRRPGTAAAADPRPDKAAGHGGRQRPSTAVVITSYSKKEEEIEDRLHMLTCADGRTWSVTTDYTLVQPKNKDIVNMEMSRPISKKFVIIRTKQDVTSSQVEKMASLMEASLKQRVAQIILRQKTSSASSVVIQCVIANRADRYLRRLADEGYDAGPAMSNEVILKEGQLLDVQFRGNVQDSEGQVMRLCFNSNIKSRQEFVVSEIDKFAQKSLECYRGFAQVYTRGFVPSEVREEDKRSGGKTATRVVLTVGNLLLTELLISLPKPEPEPPRPIVNRAPVKFNTTDLVDNPFLRQLSMEIGDEWKRLAGFLNVRRVRIQAIMRNNINADNSHAKYDMLLTWAKKVPRSMNKVDMLSNALMGAGRCDLASAIREQDSDFRRERAESARDSLLRKCFIKVAQNSHLMTDYRFFLRHLGVSELDVDDIDNTVAGVRDRCYHGLVRWRDDGRESAEVEHITVALRRCKYGNIADIVEQTL